EKQREADEAAALNARLGICTHEKKDPGSGPESDSLCELCIQILEKEGSTPPENGRKKKRKKGGGHGGSLNES
ncbi:Hypothetical protein FKW44_014127, partial [Caligus rogercresseyi]